MRTFRDFVESQNDPRQSFRAAWTQYYRKAAALVQQAIQYMQQGRRGMSDEELDANDRRELDHFYDQVFDAASLIYSSGQSQVIYKLMQSAERHKAVVDNFIETIPTNPQRYSDFSHQLQVADNQMDQYLNLLLHGG